MIVCARANGWRIDIEDFMDNRTPVGHFIRMVLGRTKLRDLYEFVLKKRQSVFSLIYHPHDSRNSQSGYPDLTMVNPNKRRVIFAELKKVGGYRSKEQKLWAAALMSALRDTPRVDYHMWDPDDWPAIVEALGGIDTGLFMGAPARRRRASASSG